MATSKNSDEDQRAEVEALRSECERLKIELAAAFRERDETSEALETERDALLGARAELDEVRGAHQLALGELDAERVEHAATRAGLQEVTEQLTSERENHAVTRTELGESVRDHAQTTAALEGLELRHECVVASLREVERELAVERVNHWKAQKKCESLSTAAGTFGATTFISLVAHALR